MIKWAVDMNRHFIAENIQMIYKNMKRSPIKLNLHKPALHTYHNGKNKN